MKLSKFGRKFTGESATVSLMDDLGEALSVNPALLFMGGGNPSRIPEAETVFRDALQAVLDDKETLHKMLGVYQPPQGDPDFLNDLAAFLNRQFGWRLTARNIAVANGSQSAFSVLFNLFAGVSDTTSEGVIPESKVQLPLVPEYVGYADVGFSDDFFVATPPTLEFLDDHTFKYRVDFDRLTIEENTGLLCVSRPTNPTGNVLTDAEIERLSNLAEGADIPFIVDGAYGTPFPNIIFTEAAPAWSDHMILVLSLSKLGLPGARTGIVVANEEVIAAFAKTNTILSLACGNLGPALGRQLLRDDQLSKLSNNIIKPYYYEAATQAAGWIRELFSDIPYMMHKPEGAIFLWLWFKDLPVTSKKLYQRLKDRGVLVLAGEDFFVGLKQNWPHQYECIRLTYCQSPDVVRKGLEIMAEEVKLIYEGK